MLHRRRTIKGIRFNTKSGRNGGFLNMQQKLFGVAVGAALLLSFGTGTALATASQDLEIVAGTDIILYAGGTATCTSGGSVVLCSTFGEGTLGNSLDATSFDGWNVSVTATSNSPNCSGLAGPGCLSTDNIDTVDVSSADALDVYFGDTSFSPELGLQVTETGSGVTGTAGAMGYAFTGPLGFSSTAAPTLSGKIGTSLSLTAPGIVTTGGTPTSGPLSLAIEDTFANGAGHTYDVDTTITAVPEPASMVLFGSMLLAITGIAKKKFGRR
jgi:hypothetical protein